MNDIFTRAGNETQRLKFSLIVNLKSSRRIVSSSNVDVSVHRVLLTAVLLVTASTRLPEFAGFRGQRYPGTCPPRRQPVEPWRPRLAQVLDSAILLSRTFWHLLLSQLVKPQGQQTSSLNCVCIIMCVIRIIPSSMLKLKNST